MLAAYSFGRWYTTTPASSTPAAFLAVPRPSSRQAVRSAQPRGTDGHDGRDHRHLRPLLELVDLVIQRVRGGHGAARAVDANHEPFDVLVLLGLAKLLLHAREDRNARRGRRQRQAEGLVGQHPG